MVVMLVFSAVKLPAVSLVNVRKSSESVCPVPVSAVAVFIPAVDKVWDRVTPPSSQSLSYESRVYSASEITDAVGATDIKQFKHETNKFAFEFVHMQAIVVHSPMLLSTDEHDDWHCVG